MIGNEFVIEFKFSDTNKALSNFFDYYRITVPAKTRENWIDEEGIGYYSLQVDPLLIKEIKKSDIESANILEQINSQNDNTIKIQYNKGTLSCGKKEGKWVSTYGNYIAIFSEYLWNKLSALFLATFISQNAHSKEGFVIKFDTVNKSAIITKVELEVPLNNPYFSFARKTAMLTTFSSIKGYALQSNGKKKANFYAMSSGTEWKKVDDFNEMIKQKIEIKNVVYMLFDVKKNYFYVGKADRLVKRLKQHQNDLKDEIREFTHFRYTPIDKSYINEIYLIENAAIHDCAAIFNMPNGVNYKHRDLETHVFNGSFSSKTIMTNRVEKQTK